MHLQEIRVAWLARSMSIQVKEIAFIYHCVTDVARARRFYEQFLGLKVGLEYEGAPGKWWIEYDIAGVAFAITNVSPRRKKRRLWHSKLSTSTLRLPQSAPRTFLLREQLTEFPRCRSFEVTDPEACVYLKPTKITCPLCKALSYKYLLKIIIGLKSYIRHSAALVKMPSITSPDVSTHLRHG